MADNKEITTLHPYMNRYKNRYPNVREENIPDTIQRTLTAGQGINISPENVISATGGDSYTRDETDALLDTKANKVALENVNKAVPTDIAVKDGKLGLEHNTTWLTNQKAINLGENITYDVTTNTLNASGGKLPAGTIDNPFMIDNLNVYKNDYWLSLKNQYAATNIYIGHQQYSEQSHIELLLSTYSNANTIGSTKKIITSWNRYNQIFNLLAPNSSGDYDILSLKRSDFKNKGIVSYYKDSDGIFATSVSVPTNKTESYYLAATYDSTSKKTTITWSSLIKTYNHYIVINDTTTANAIYLLIPSTNNLKCNSLTDLNNLLGTAQRFIQASGVVTDTASKLPIVALNWQGSIATSKIMTMSSEEATTKFTNVVDVVEPA